MCKKSILVGGGTGGHAFPLLNLAQYIGKSHSEVVFHWIGEKNSIEEKLSKIEADRVLRIIIDWARYAEIFAYNYHWLDNFGRSVVAYSIFNEVDEGIHFEGGAADEGSVDVFLPEEFGGVICFDAATVLDADFFSDIMAVEVGEDGAHEGVGVLRLLRAGDDTSAYGPDGFIGEDAF